MIIGSATGPNVGNAELLLVPVYYIYWRATNGPTDSFCWCIEKWQYREVSWLIAFCPSYSLGLSVPSSSLVSVWCLCMWKYVPVCLSVYVCTLRWALALGWVNTEAWLMPCSYSVQVAAILSQSRMWAPIRAVIQIPASCSIPSPLATACLSPKLSIVNRISQWLWLRPSPFSSRTSVCILQAQARSDRQIDRQTVREYFQRKENENGRAGLTIWLWAVNTCHGSALLLSSHREEIVSGKV